MSHYLNSVILEGFLTHTEAQGLRFSCPDIADWPVQYGEHPNSDAHRSLCDSLTGPDFPVHVRVVGKIKHELNAPSPLFVALHIDQRPTPRPWTIPDPATPEAQ